MNIQQKSEAAFVDGAVSGREGANAKTAFQCGKVEKGNSQKNDKKEKSQRTKEKLFRPYKVKDIVFLAVIAAVMLVTSMVMPLVAHVPIFGVIQIVLGLQFSIFPAIALMKVRKPGALLFVSVFSGIILVFVNTIMFFCLIACALIAEAIALLFFNGYRSDGACFTAAALYLPLTLPFLYVWYKIIGGADTVASYANSSPVVTALMSLAVIALCGIGSLIGVKISRELKKSGIMKK